MNVKQLNKLKSLLDLLSKEQEMFARLDLGILHNGDTIEKSHSGYLHLLGLLHNPLEKDFYKSNWVNIVRDDYVFIDIAKEDWSIFDCHYNCFSDTAEEHYWYKDHLFIDLNDLIENIGDIEHLKYVRNQNRDSKRNDVDDWLDELVK